MSKSISDSMSKSIPDGALLRLALVADAIATGATGVLMAAGASLLAPLLGLPQPLLLWAGLPLIPFAAFVGWAGLREAPPRGAVGTIVAVNLAWVAASALLPALLPVAPTALGIAFVAMQAGAVLVLAALQWIGAARAGRAPTCS